MHRVGVAAGDSDQVAAGIKPDAVYVAVSLGPNESLHRLDGRANITDGCDTALQIIIHELEGAECGQAV